MSGGGGGGGGGEDKGSINEAHCAMCRRRERAKLASSKLFFPLLDSTLPLPSAVIKRITDTVLLPLRGVEEDYNRKLS